MYSDVNPIYFLMLFLLAVYKDGRIYSHLPPSPPPDPLHEPPAPGDVGDCGKRTELNSLALLAHLLLA